MSNASKASNGSTRPPSNNLEDLKKRLGNDVYDPSEEDYKANDVIITFTSINQINMKVI